MITSSCGKSRTLTTALVAVLVLTLAGCSDGGDDSGGGGGGAVEQGGGGDAGAGTDLEVGSLLQVNFVHEADSGDGESPWGDAEVRLLFEPGDQLALFVADGENGLGRHGTYEYTGGTLHLSLDAEEVSVDDGFDLDLAAPTVEMPFQVFSAEDGTSTWRREVVGPMSGTDHVFQAARFDDVESIPREDAISRAQEYAAARVETDDAGFGDAVDLGALDEQGDDEEHGLGAGALAPLPRSGAGPRVRLASTGQQSDGNVPSKLVDTEPFTNGVTMVYDDGTRATVLLYSWAPPGASDPVNLTPAPFAGDPRVELPTQEPGDGTHDPASKTALLANPFATSFGETGVIADATVTLEGRGYTVTTLTDDAVTFEALVEALTDGGAPGFLTLSTHGGASGAMATAETLGDPDDILGEWRIGRNMRAVAERIDEVYPGSRAFEVDGKVFQPFQPLLYSDGAGNQMTYVGLSPSFWKWLDQEQDADFTDSFVFLSACDSDTNPDIRVDVNAEVFMGFSDQANIVAARTAFGYLVEQLARPTRSVEEAHYNLVRVINTEQSIFKEDLVFDGTPSSGLPEILEVYSGGDVSPESYEDRGFLDTTRNLGQLWWLTYSGRWSGDAAEGAQKLQNCWDQFWSQGNKGGLASPACNASNTGTLPTQDEVAYAKYLLTGDQSAVSGTSVARWTLADGG